MIEENLYLKTVKSPVGELTLIASDKGLRALLLPGGKKRIAGAFQKNDTHPILLKAEKQLAEYFSGTRTSFDLPLEMRGTIFQIKAWRELQKIGYGETISYGEQAKRMGDSKKARPAGAANGQNPISIIVPCHRVIGASGDLTGFGGGVKMKEQLLALEQKTLSKQPRSAA